MRFEFSVESDDQKRIVYLPKGEADLIQDIYFMLIEGLRFIAYFNYFCVNQQRFNLSDKTCLDWYGHTRHSYYHLAITHWCRIFNSKGKNEQTNFLQLTNKDKTKSFLGALKKIEIDRKSFREKILKDIQINNKELSSIDFDKYLEDTLKYRNRYSVHKEYLENRKLAKSFRHPELDIACETFLSLSLIMNKAAEHLSQNKENEDDVSMEFYTATNKDDFIKIAFLTPDKLISDIQPFISVGLGSIR